MVVVRPDVEVPAPQDEEMKLLCQQSRIGIQKYLREICQGNWCGSASWPPTAMKVVAVQSLRCMPSCRIPPQSLQAKFQSGSEPAKTHILWLLEPVEDPKDQNYFKTSYFEALGACEEFVISLNYEKIQSSKKICVFFVLEPARLLGACKPGSRARMDSTGWFF